VPYTAPVLFQSMNYRKLRTRELRRTRAIIGGLGLHSRLRARKRTRYQEMAADAASPTVEDNDKTAEEELHILQRRTEHLA
jgi:hypothetical protein